MTTYRDDNPAGLALSISDKDAQWPPNATDLKSYYNSIVRTSDWSVVGMDDDMHAVRLAQIHRAIKDRFLESLKAEVHGEYVPITLVLTFYKSELAGRHRLHKHKELLLKQIRWDYRANKWTFDGVIKHETKCLWPFLGKKERHKFILEFNCSPLE